MGETTDPGAIVSAEGSRKPLYQRGQSPRRKCNAVLIHSVCVKVCAVDETARKHEGSLSIKRFFLGTFFVGSVEKLISIF